MTEEQRNFARICRQLGKRIIRVYIKDGGGAVIKEDLGPQAVVGFAGLFERFGDIGRGEVEVELGENGEPVAILKGERSWKVG